MNQITEGEAQVDGTVAFSLFFSVRPGGSHERKIGVAENGSGRFHDDWYKKVICIPKGTIK